MNKTEPLSKSMTKREILEYLEQNNGWVLQYCLGTRDGWWWLRKNRNSSETISVNGNSARAAAKSLKCVHSDWRETTYA